MKSSIVKRLAIAGALMLAAAVFADTASAIPSIPRRYGTSRGRTYRHRPSNAGGYYRCIGRCNFRTGPGTNYPVKYELPDNIEVYVYYRSGNWYKCQIDEGPAVWTHIQNLRR